MISNYDRSVLVIPLNQFFIYLYNIKYVGVIRSMKVYQIISNTSTLINSVDVVVYHMVYLAVILLFLCYIGTKTMI